MVYRCRMNDPSLYVDKWYTANAEFEDIVFGDELREGMFVLLEDDLMRQNLDAMHSSYDTARADTMNRWCEVTQLRTIPRPEMTSPLIRFVARYADGTMKVRNYDAGYAWIVKRELRAE